MIALCAFTNQKYLNFIIKIYCERLSLSYNCNVCLIITNIYVMYNAHIYFNKQNVRPNANSINDILLIQP